MSAFRWLFFRLPLRRNSSCGCPIVRLGGTDRSLGSASESPPDPGRPCSPKSVIPPLFTSRLHRWLPLIVDEWQPIHEQLIHGDIPAVLGRWQVHFNESSSVPLKACKVRRLWPWQQTCHNPSGARRAKNPDIPGDQEQSSPSHVCLAKVGVSRPYDKLWQRAFLAWFMCVRLKPGIQLWPPFAAQRIRIWVSTRELPAVFFF